MVVNIVARNLDHVSDFHSHDDWNPDESEEEEERVVRELRGIREPEKLLRLHCGTLDTSAREGEIANMLQNQRNEYLRVHGI